MMRGVACRFWCLGALAVAGCHGVVQSEYELDRTAAVRVFNDPEGTTDRMVELLESFARSRKLSPAEGSLSRSEERILSRYTIPSASEGSATVTLYYCVPPNEQRRHYLVVVVGPEGDPGTEKLDRELQTLMVEKFGPKAVVRRPSRGP